MVRESSNTIRSGLVLSDLHLFSPRSIAPVLLEEQRSRIRNAGCLILNGDIFDFRWSSLPDHRATITAAIDWLDGLLDDFQGDAIHYLLGNHDCLGIFRTELEERFSKRPRLRIHEHRLILSRNVFLHGDCANARMSGTQLARHRQSWSEHGRKGGVGRALYRVADATGHTRRFHDLHFPQQTTVERIAHHLNDVLPTWRDEIDHCYFGHTHRPFRGHEYDGVLFHNTGSGIRSMGFQPLEFEV